MSPTPLSAFIGGDPGTPRVEVRWATGGAFCGLVYENGYRHPLSGGGLDFVTDAAIVFSKLTEIVVGEGHPREAREWALGKLREFWEGEVRSEYDQWS